MKVSTEQLVQTVIDHRRQIVEHTATLNRRMDLYKHRPMAAYDLLTEIRKLENEIDRLLDQMLDELPPGVDVLNLMHQMHKAA